MKKILSLFTALAIMLSLGVVHAEGIRISGTSANVKAGETVEVTFSISGNPGIKNFDIKLVWDKSAFTLTEDDTIIGDVFANGEVTEDRATAGKYKISCNNDENVTIDGELFTVKFDVSDKAKIGSYFVSIGVNNLENAAGEKIKTSLSLPNISVIEEAGAKPTEAPTVAPTETPAPTKEPSGGGGGGGVKPTAKPTETPTVAPTTEPTEEPAGNDVFKPAFTDVKETDWYYDSVRYVYTKGLMNGTSDTEFAPGVSLTRAMLVTVLWRLEEEPVVNYLMPFGDIAQETWYAEAVRWAASEGIVNGVTDTSFAPDSNITREQIATIMYRYAQYKDVAPTGTWAIQLDYSDLADISDYAMDGVMYCKLKGIMQGKDNNNFAPKDNATRAEIATILQRFVEGNK